MDCDRAQNGCSGGVPPKAVQHITQRGGLELESVYPYVFAKSSCKFNKQNVRVKVASPIVGFKGVNEEGVCCKFIISLRFLVMVYNLSILRAFYNNLLRTFLHF